MSGESVSVRPIIERSPAQCSQSELAAFAVVAAKGGEVEADDIVGGAKRAFQLLWISDASGNPCATAALKSPNLGYKTKVFKQSGLPDDAAARFDLELGYVFVDPARRQDGHGTRLATRAVQIAGARPVYATSRSDNHGMRRILERLNFVIVGTEYSSARDDAIRLRLFLRDSGSLSPGTALGSAVRLL
jgi:ribosomal protein S18 acetylase RimI-like enzyme